MKHQPILVEQPDYSRWIVLLPVALLLSLILLKPMPLYGGIADDFRYLEAAQCLECLPTNHWERRFALVWPTGISIRLFGQNTWSVMLAPMIGGIAALILTFKLVEWHYGRLAGLIAASVLAVTPVFTDRSMRVSVDVIELAFLLGSVFLLQRHKSHFWAGALLALAVLCRPTQLAALPLVGLLAWWQDRRLIWMFAIGFLTPVALEALVYLIAVGDPLYPWKLSLNHMASWRASMDIFHYARFISPDVDTSQSPLFNINLIDGWMPISGIDTHWTIQGFVNLLFNVECGITLLAALAIVLISAKRLDKLQIGMIVGAALFFGALTYAFAVDPRPRMFFPIIVVAAALIGSLGPTLWRWPYKILAGLFVLLIPLTTVVNIIQKSDFSAAAAKANDMLSRQPYLVTAVAKQRMSLIRQDFPTDGLDLIHIDIRCNPRMEGRWLAYREGRLCIYRQFPWPFEPYRNGVEQWGQRTPWMLYPPQRC